MSKPITENTTLAELALFLEARQLQIVFLGAAGSGPMFTVRVRWRHSGAVFQSTRALVHEAINEAIAFAELG